jgi:hypothetical protein
MSKVTADFSMSTDGYRARALGFANSEAPIGGN